MREEKRKKLKEMNSNRMTCRTISTLALHDGLLLAAEETVREKPMNIAAVKREFTCTIPSRAVTWTLVFDRLVVEGGDAVVASCWLIGREFGIYLWFSSDQTN